MELLRLIVLMACLPHRSVGDADKDLTFLAYDCSAPDDVEAVRAAPQDCQGREAVRDQANATYMVLQEAEYVRVPVQVCEVYRSKIAAYCGTYDHQTLVPQLLEVRKAWRVDPVDCRRAWDAGDYVDPRRDHHKIRPNATNHFNYEDVGHTTYDTNHVDCVGGRVRINSGHTLDHINVAVHVEWRMYTEEALIRKNAIVLHRRQLQLRCRASQGECVGSEATYLWNVPSEDDVCRLHKTRIAKGMQLTGERGTVSFLSTDGSMIRVIRREAIHRCGQVVYRTNYRAVYLADDLSHSPFQVPLHPAERSPTLYANMQDAYLYGTLTRAIRREFTAMLQKECQRQSEAQAKALAAIAAESRATLDGETTHLGDGVYASAAGEVWYRYQCRPVYVQALQRDKCYAALPVKLQEKDLRHYWDLRAERTTEERYKETRVDLDFFMEPETHRLTTVGIPVTCTPHFKAMYLSVTNQWWQVNPKLTRVTAPRDIRQDYQHITPKLPEEMDFEKGGVYSASDVREMDLFAQTPRKVEDVARGLGVQAYRGDDGHIGPHQMFPELPDLDYKSTIMNHVWLWLDRWGNIMSILIGCGLVFKVVTWLAGLVFRLLEVRRLHGCGLHLLAACFPSAWFALLRQPTAPPPMEPVRTNATAAAPRDFAAEEAALQHQLHNLHRDRQLAQNGPGLV